MPPGVINWNDADDNNAFHSKLIVMDFDGSLSTEVALYNDKEEYNDIVTYGMPLGNDGKQVAARSPILARVIPKGAKNVAVAKEFLKYAIEPKVLNEYLKGGLGRWAIPMPEMIKTDPFWLDPKDPHRRDIYRADAVRPDIAALRGLQPGVRRNRYRACLPASPSST